MFLAETRSTSTSKVNETKAGGLDYVFFEARQMVPFPSLIPVYGVFTETLDWIVYDKR